MSCTGFLTEDEDLSTPRRLILKLEDMVVTLILDGDSRVHRWYLRAIDTLYPNKLLSFGTDHTMKPIVAKMNVLLESDNIG